MEEEPASNFIVQSGYTWKSLNPQLGQDIWRKEEAKIKFLGGKMDLLLYSIPSMNKSTNS